MTKCIQCGASLGPGAEKCDYCGLLTEAGQRAEAQARQREVAQAEVQSQQHAKATISLEKDATNALVWSLLGLVSCCAFIPAVVGLSKASSVASRARVAGVPSPSNIRSAQVLGWLGLVFGLGFWVVAVVGGTRDAEANKKRAAALNAILGDAPRRPDLSQDTACKLAEYYAVTHGYDGSSGTYANTFSCPHLVEVAGDRASMEKFTFKPSSSGNAVEVWACFRRGDRWYVDALKSEPCVRAPAQRK